MASAGESPGGASLGAIGSQTQRTGTPLRFVPQSLHPPKGQGWGDPFPTGTLVKGFLLSFNMAARQVSSRALSRARAMSASLNCNNQAPAHQSVAAPPSLQEQEGRER